MKLLGLLFRFIFRITGLFGCFFAALLAGFTLYFGPQLPKIQSIQDMKLQTPLRVYTADGKLMGEFGEIRRQPVAYQDLPPLFIKAVLAAEDDRFFSHPGVDATGLLRAAMELAQSGRIQSGGSTITMQLARNFYLSSEKSFIRKFNEVLLSLLLERTLSKEQIFELYANKIFLGNTAYGAQAAAQIYYGKTLGELNIAELAMLAGLPKAPSKYNPIANPERSRIRRDWILRRMQELNFITHDEYASAILQPVDVTLHKFKTDIDAPYAAEMARLFALDKLGAAAFTDGYNVHTTFDSQLQLTAQQAVWEGVLDYDHRHGYRGPEAHVDLPTDINDKKAWKKIFSTFSKIADLEPAVVIAVNKQAVKLRLPSGNEAFVAWQESTGKLLQPYRNENTQGPLPTDFAALFKPGDLLRLRQTSDGLWNIAQVPRVQAALAAINPENGAVVALSGGSDFHWSKFNRATQALRQPGSSFKPFIYLKGLEEGYTPATLINDAPLVFHEAGMPEAWRPQNFDDEYHGPTRMRQALYESRNMVSIRILMNVGVKNLIAGLPRFGFDTRTVQPNLSLALGSHGFSPLTMANAYAVLANGGYQVSHFWVTRIEDNTGALVYEHKPATVCAGCPDNLENVVQAKRVVDEQSAYMIDDMLKDVIRKGTGKKALALNRKDLAGKTGTTNGPTDAWFSGYSPLMAASAWVGFDDNTYLGKKEFGGTAALPIWIHFMEAALKDKPDSERLMPPSLATRRVDPASGYPAGPDTENAIFEIIRVPKEDGEHSEDALPNETGESDPASPSSEVTDDLF